MCNRAPVDRYYPSGRQEFSVLEINREFDKEIDRFYEIVKRKKKLTVIIDEEILVVNVISISRHTQLSGVVCPLRF